ncbi:MAG: glycosyltransferase family 2 protein [Bradymonadaceae bacterium]
MPDRERPTVSVIIPVYDDYLSLLQCLDALAEQTYPDDRYEVVVVDNGTPDERRASVDELHECVRTTSESTPGSYAARNRGIAESTGEVLAFTDADCRPSPDWLEAGVRALASTPGVGLVGGPVCLYPREQPPTCAEVWELTEGFPQQKYVEELDFAATANMLTRREVVDDVGDFDTDFRSGGDREWGERVARAGYDQVFESAARVRHPARRHLRDLLGKTVRTTRGDYRRMDKLGEWTALGRPRRIAQSIVELALAVPKAGWRSVARANDGTDRLKYACADVAVRATKESTLAGLLLTRALDRT